MGQIIKIPPKIEDTLFSRLQSNLIEVYDNDNTTLRDFIDNNGFKQVRYRDEYVGSVWLVPSGVQAPDTKTVTIGGVTTQKYAFDGGNTEEKLSNSFEIPHDLDLVNVNNGTYKIEWHVHFRPDTIGSGYVKWFFDWTYTPPNLAPIPMTALSCKYYVLANTQYYHLLVGTELPIPAGGYQIGGVISFQLRRTPNDSEDTYTGDALLIKTALHVPINDRGSRQRYIK